MKNGMGIYILTRGRVHRQPLYDQLDPTLKRATLFVVGKDEAKDHLRLGRRVLVSPAQGKGLGTVRDWVIANVKDRFVFLMDDDIKLQTRQPDGKITDATHSQQRAMLEQLIYWMERGGFPHVSAATRSADFASEKDFKNNGRAMHLLGFDRKVLLKEKLLFMKGMPPFALMTDFHMTLQLLRRGYPNRVIMCYRVAPLGSNARGGCSEYRTVALKNECAQRLAKMHAPFVKLREKEAWRGMEGKHLDVTVYWQKAFKGANA